MPGMTYDVAVIGAGGAARAALWSLKRQQANVKLFNRTVSSARELGQVFDVSYEPLQSASFRDYDLVVNATPLGSGEFKHRSPATADQLAGSRYVYDLVYNPIETELIKEASKIGCKTISGLEMLVAQARIQFELWTGQAPSSSLMYDAAAAALGQ